jgi:methyltransferase (TIGR00027 family)
MRRNQSSLTATGIAIARGVESERPAGERICYDPYARQFVPTWMYRLLSFFIKSGYAELRGPGVNAFLVARERYIDDVLQQSLKEGLQQLVILGAGFDMLPPTRCTIPGLAI